MQLTSKLVTTAVPLLVLGLVACSESPTDPGTGGTPGPAPTPRVDVTLESRYIKIHGTCDTNVLGNSAAGEFHYEVSLEGPGRTVTHGTTNYNDVTASAVSRSRNELIDFGNRTLTFTNLEAGTEVSVLLGLVEWDGPIRDGRMNNLRWRVRPDTEVFGTRTESISLGSGDCHGELFFDVTVTER